MTKETGLLLQEEFIALCKKYGLKSSSGFFVDTDGKSMMAFNKISDNDIMHYIANLVIRIARKNKMSVYDVLVSLNTGIKEQGEFH